MYARSLPKKTTNVTVILTVTDEEGYEHELVINGEVEPARRASRAGDPGDWEPDDPGCVEVIEIVDEHGEQVADAQFKTMAGPDAFAKATSALAERATERYREMQDAYDAQTEDARDGEYWL